MGKRDMRMAKLDIAETAEIKVANFTNTQDQQKTFRKYDSFNHRNL